MHCSEATQQLQFYIDHQLTLKQIRELEAHLSRCTVCQEELFLLERVADAVQNLDLVVEPDNLTERIMQRVALTPQHPPDPIFFLLRPSLKEVLAVVVLATVTTLGIILGQPSLRSVLPFANGHDSLSFAFMNTLHLLLNLDAGTLTLALWLGGTVLGVGITLVLAGAEMRTKWRKAMMDHLPSW